MHVNYQDISQHNKIEKYEYAISVAQTMMQQEPNVLATTANVTALLRQVFGWFWIGFYWVDQPNELVLGPFQGTLACTRIAFGKGVCGTAWREQKTQVVPNVHEYPGHIACSNESQSEIVVPIFSYDHQVLGVLDVDSVRLNEFDSMDAYYLEQLCQHLGAYIARHRNK